MEVLHAAELPWGESLVAQRGGGEVAHKRLFEGAEDSADNYMLVMSKEPRSFYSPRHRHAWDQIRFCLEGSIPIAKDMSVEGGEIAYFPESAYYGPQAGGEDRIVLLLQFGGASGQGFIGPDRVKQARLELAREGHFEGGVYHRHVTEGRRNWDAYEAIWLHLKGGALSYAPPVYKAPIVMRPDALPWLPTAAAGVSLRQIGAFPHRGLTIDGWRFEAGASLQIPAAPALRLLFVTDGAGAVGTEPLRRWSAVRVHPDESAVLRSTGHLEVIALGVRPVAAGTPAACTDESLGT